MIKEWYELPVFYFTNPSSLAGHGDAVAVPPGCQKLDFELEVAAVVGRRGENLKVSEARRHIVGYMLMNDWSARDLQRKEMLVGLGPAKGKDFRSSFGPALVTATCQAGVAGTFPALNARTPEEFDERLARVRTVYDFDELVTGPLHGFAGADDYWRRASSKPWLRTIEVPTLLINARNDPFLPPQILPDADEVAPAVRLEFTEEGGHVGFVSGDWPGHLDWLPRRLMHFLRHAA